MLQSCFPFLGKANARKKPLEDTFSEELCSFLEKLKFESDEELNVSAQDRQVLDKHLEEVGQVYHVFRQAKSKILEQDRRKWSDEIRGDFDSPLDKIFHDLKPFFLLDYDSFTNLASVSKGMRQALKDMPVYTDHAIKTTRKTKTLHLRLPVVHDKLCPRLVNYSCSHETYGYDDRRPRVDVVLDSNLMNLHKNLESFSFTTSFKVAHDLKFQDFQQGFESLYKFKIEAKRSPFSFSFLKLWQVQENRLWLPKDLNICFASLKSLHLVDVICTEKCSILHLPETLEELFVERVQGLIRLRMMSTHRLRDVKLVNVPDLLIKTLPQVVKKLFVSSAIFDQIESLPYALESLALDGKDIYSLFKMDYSHFHNFNEKMQSRILPRLKFLHIQTVEDAIYNVPIADFVVCEACHEARKVVVGAEVSMVILKSFYSVRDIDIANGVEHVSLRGLSALEAVVLPASCRSLFIFNCRELKTIVFRGCAPERIYLSSIEKLQEVQVEEGATVPQGILDVMTKHGRYPAWENTSEKLRAYLNYECEDTFAEWIEES